jgi:S-adenosylmethionine uptake transporter
MQSLWMLLAALLFAVMGVCVKLAASRYAVAEIVFYRSLFGTVALGLFVRARGLSLRTSLPWVHLRRGAVGTLSLAMWFYATSMLPLATAITLNYTSPLFVACFSIAAALAVGRPLNMMLLVTIAIGFAGVSLVLQPSFGAGQLPGALIGLGSGLLSAVAYWHVRDLGRRGEPEWRTVFYFSLVGAVLGLAGTLVTGFSIHNGRGLLLLLGVGVSATLAQLAMTRAYGRGHALLTANLQFSAIVFASILGNAVFDDRMPGGSWIGIVLIIGAAIAATALIAARARAAAPAQPIAEGLPDRT